MKFNTTENTTYRGNIGYVPKPWIECDSEDHETCIRRYFIQNIKVWDFDECGCETHDFVFDTGRAFRLEYSWWMEWHHEDDEMNGPNDEMIITEISVEEADVPDKNPKREWL